MSGQNLVDLCKMFKNVTLGTVFWPRKNMSCSFHNISFILCRWSPVDMSEHSPSNHGGQRSERSPRSERSRSERSPGSQRSGRSPAMDAEQYLMERNISQLFQVSCFRPRFCSVRLYWAGDNLG